MIYIPIDKKARVSYRQNNVLYINTVMVCVNSKFPGVVAIASTLTGGINEYMHENKLYTIDKESFITGRFKGMEYTQLFPRLFLVMKKPADIINLADYLGKNKG